MRRAIHSFLVLLLSSHFAKLLLNLWSPFESHISNGDFEKQKDEKKNKKKKTTRKNEPFLSLYQDRLQNREEISIVE